jgi:endonuclease/exonuclease/phosphatase family metal-dependent hydrolase
MTHLLFFCPRWFVSVPTLLLVPLAVRMRLGPETVALAAAAILFVVGIWGFNVPCREFVPGGTPPGMGLRVLTCNVQGADLKVQEFADLIRGTWPDIVLLQEFGHTDPRALLEHESWSVRTSGEFCLASRHPIESFEALARPDKQYRTVAVRARISWPGRTLPVVSVHLMTPRDGIEAILGGKWRGIDAFREIAAVQRFESDLVRRRVAEGPGSILLAGDFNLTSEHPLFRSDWSGYTDAFSRTGWGLGHTMFSRRIGLRIDHVLCGPGWRPIRCWVKYPPLKGRACDSTRHKAGIPCPPLSVTMGRLTDGPCPEVQGGIQVGVLRVTARLA